RARESPGRADLRGQGGRRRVSVPGRDRAPADRARSAPGAHGRPLEGRRPVRVRPRRRGGRGSARRRRPLRSRAGRDGWSCGASTRQRVVTSTLESIAAAAQAEGIRPPALTVIGRVVELRDRIGWFELRPLTGITVAVTRARAQASALATRLRALGAAAIET